MLFFETPSINCSGGKVRNYLIGVFRRSSVDWVVVLWKPVFCLWFWVVCLIKMPRIDQDIKLDFKDVLFRPKRSTIRSRSDVSIFRMNCMLHLHPLAHAVCQWAWHVGSLMVLTGCWNSCDMTGSTMYELLESWMKWNFKHHNDDYDKWSLL